jgi:WD40 repeat protein
MIVVWDSMNGTPIKTIFNPHPNGVLAMDLSPDALFLVTISAVQNEGDAQEISLWEWTTETEGALYTEEVTAQDVQTCVRFNTSDIREIVTNGQQRVIFWNWEQRKFNYYSPPLSQRDFKQSVGAFTQTIFIPESTQAVTATVDGDLVLWDRSLVGQGKGASKPGDKRAIKIIRVSGTDAKGNAVGYMAPSEGYLVIGTDDGAVRFYDHQFRLVAWFEDLEAGPVTSVSFANARPPPLDPSSQDSFTVPDFVVGTKKAFIVGVEAALFEEVLPERRRGTLLVQGLDDEVHGLATHPYLTQIAVSCYSGSLQLWDYEEKRLLMVRPFDPTKMRPQCLAFDPNGRFLAVGFTNGLVKVLDAAR